MKPFGLSVAGGRVVVGNGGGASLEVFDTAVACVRTIRAGLMASSVGSSEHGNVRGR